MAGISPQSIAASSGGIRRKRRSPYVDMIRGQHGQATQNVLAQRQEEQTQKQQKTQNKYQQQSLNLMAQNQKFQKDRDKQQGLMSMLGTGIQTIGTMGNLYNQMGGISGIKSGLSSFGDSLMSGFGLFD